MFVIIRTGLGNKTEHIMIPLCKCSGTSWNTACSSGLSPFQKEFYRLQRGSEVSNKVIKCIEKFLCKELLNKITVITTFRSSMKRQIRLIWESFEPGRNLCLCLFQPPLQRGVNTEFRLTRWELWPVRSFWVILQRWRLNSLSVQLANAKLVFSEKYFFRIQSKPPLFPLKATELAHLYQ